MDHFESHAQSLVAPLRDAGEVTPDDATDLPVLPRAIYVGQSGDIALITAQGSPVTLVAVPAGSLIPLRAARIKATGTTAASIVALW